MTDSTRRTSEIAPDGGVKMLDCGLADLLDTDDATGGSGPNVSHSPTRSLTAASSGSLSGTAAYLAPEQTRGEVPDARADVWGYLGS